MDTTDVSAIRVDILRKARELVKEDRFGYLCNAIAEAGWLLDQEREAEILVAWVQRMLAPFTTYTSWLRQNHPDVYNRKGKKGHPKKGRLAWIDWMIQEVQS